LAFKLKKKAKQNNDQNLRFTSLLFLLKGIILLIVGNTYVVLKSKGLSSENMQNLILISTVTIGLCLLIIGLRFLLQSKKSGFKLGMAGGAIWILVAIGGLYGGLKVASKMNSGWTKERQTAILNKANSLKFRKLCYLDQVMNKFPNPEDFNNMTEAQETELNKLTEENCLLCDVEFEKKATNEVDGLPDDF
jgi:membrane-associated HD superfamily phosphohydrolase